MPYEPIENHGIIGNMRTAALVGLSGTIDWLCFPRFDSPSVFAAILDAKKGGHFKIAPVGAGAVHKQLYWPGTNVLITRFLSEDGVGEITDYMPVGEQVKRDGVDRLVRRINVVRGRMKFHVECRPAFNYARDAHETVVDRNGAAFHAPGLSLGLSASIPLERNAHGVRAEVTLDEGQTTRFVLSGIAPGAQSAPAPAEEESVALFKDTVDFWTRWLSKCSYKGRWREMVERSALTLKLLTYEPTGAIVAAPTCSLPEGIGGERNWDYRYTWIRDAAFTVYSLMRIGFTEEASKFMEWIEARCHDRQSDGRLQVLYGIDGRSELAEETLEHLEGYRGSRPVRIGNGAANQLQLDIYGELMDAVYLSNKYRGPITYELWQALEHIVNWVCDNWQRKDDGIWEVRGGQQHFVYSKLMTWVALDRALRLADQRAFPADRDRWVTARDRVYEQIMTQGWSEQRQAFVQHFGSNTLDAANLMMPLVFFVAPTEPRMLKTLDTIYQTPQRGGLVSNSLVYRYNVDHTADGLSGEEGTFNMCTFWLVDALTRAGRFDSERLLTAQLMFERMLGYANHLGLYAEETGPRGEALGNFPQAFTHLALISAAYNLDAALGPGTP
jgi:GH15 family glucan-1,4-alpha-glucosidase